MKLKKFDKEKNKVLKKYLLEVYPIEQEILEKLKTEFDIIDNGGGSTTNVRVEVRDPNSLDVNNYKHYQKNTIYSQIVAISNNYDFGTESSSTYDDLGSGIISPEYESKIADIKARYEADLARLKIKHGIENSF